MAPQDIDETLILPEKRISKPNKNTLHAFALEAEKPQTASAAAKRAGDPITDEADVVPARKKKKKSRPNKMPDLELDELPALEPVSGVQRPQVASPAPPTSTTAVYPSTPNLVAEVTRRKRTKGPKYPFRHEYLGRPLKDCAADHPAFWGSDSLVWSFLSITNLHYKDDDDEVLESCHVTCGICIHAGKSHVKTWPKYNRLKSGGSSGNFITHFEGVHALFWENAKAKDQSKMNPDQQATKEKASGTLDGWAKVSA
ncbi:hypothetical protein DL93DRAFT_2086899 [Clavulina sp. PMI_390]|nr:hypothetical protein DL93DRAFT_2086899 [Clavulina sp. PMI_390]